MPKHSSGKPRTPREIADEVTDFLVGYSRQREENLKRASAAAGRIHAQQGETA